MSSGDKGGLDNNFGRNFSAFKYDRDYETDNDKISTTVGTIVSSAHNEKWINGLQDFAFHRYTSLYRKGDIEISYKVEFK